jgi:predicted nucleic acid-binding protein
MERDFVVDTSVVMTWCFEDERSAYTDKVLESLAFRTAFVPSIWPLEVGNVLLVAERKKRLSKADSIRFISLLTQLPIMVEQEPPVTMMKDIIPLARENRLSTYDASYLELAMRKGLPIATLDQRLRKAARRSRVPLA